MAIVPAYKNQKINFKKNKPSKYKAIDIKATPKSRLSVKKTLYLLTLIIFKPP